MKKLELERKYIFQEYLKLERNSEEKYEYHDGQIFAMAVEDRSTIK